MTDALRFCAREMCDESWRAFADHTDCPITIIDRKGTYRYANEPLCSLIGAGHDRVLGSNVVDWFEPDFVHERMKFIEETIKKGVARRAIDIVRGRRFFAVVRPVKDGPWIDCLLAIMTSRVPKYDVKPRPTRFRNHDLGILAQLTPREMEVLRFIAMGYSQRQIAEKLNRNIKTIESHRASIGSKLAIRKNMKLAQIAHMAGLLDDPSEAVSGFLKDP